MTVEQQAQNVPPVVGQKVQEGLYPPGMVPYWPQTAREDEIDLREIWNTIWTGKKVIITTTFVFAVVAIIVSLVLPNIYKSEVLLAPAIQEEQGGLAGLAGQFGGLASLAGINLGGSGVDKTTLALEVVKSRAFVADFIHKYQLEVPLMAAKGWNAETKTWVIDEDDYDFVNKKWIRDVKPPYKPEPSDLELHEEFTKNVLSINQDAKTGLVRVSVSLMSPEESARWVALLINNLNEYMRRRDVAEAEKSIAYLNEQLSKTALADMQKIFYQLIEQQTKTVMLASVRLEYVLATIDPATIPEEKSKPKRALIVVISSISGILFSVILILLVRRRQ